MRVILIGGTSHAGKSTTAQCLAESLGWDCQSTDKLARHPGRPWNTSSFTVPPHVADHYRELPIDDLVVDVLRHYRQNVVPQVEALIRERTSNASARGLIIEGSAIYPEFIIPFISEQVAAIWLTAPDELLSHRLHVESCFMQRSVAEQFLINKFLERTLEINRRIMAAVNQSALLSISIGETDTPESVARSALRATMGK